MKTIGTQGLPFDTAQRAPRLYNRTGATIQKGYVGFLDTSQSDAASTTVALALSNVVKPTTALIAKRAQKLVVCQDAGLADDAQGRFAMGDGGDLICQILVEGTTDVAKGDLLKPVDAQYYLVKATAGTDLAFAEALEAQTSATPTLILCRLFDRAFV